MVETQSDAPKGQPSVRTAIGSTRIYSCEASLYSLRILQYKVLFYTHMLNKIESDVEALLAIYE